MLPAKKNLASEFARSYGFQRAKERAQSSRPSSSPDHRSSANGASKSIDAPFAITKSLHPTDSPSSLVKEGATPSSEKSIENLNISLMEKHFSTATIWDQDFPSMCSYVSDYDPTKSPGLLSEIVLETPKLDLESLNEGSENDSRNFSDPDMSYCIKRPHIGSNKLTHQNDEKIHNPNLLQELSATDYRKTGKPENRRRGRNNLSFSASIPSDVHGVIADSIAVVKVSSYPYDDFRESMLEMIGKNNLSLLDVEDVEELLYCYFCLNSPEHYELIRESFFDACNQLLSYNGAL